MLGSEFRGNSVNGLQTITDLQQIRQHYKNTNSSVKFREQLVQIAQKINSTAQNLCVTIFNLSNSFFSQ